MCKQNILKSLGKFQVIKGFKSIKFQIIIYFYIFEALVMN